jgi:hypothetical protein
MVSRSERTQCAKGHTPPRVICEKRRQAVENKRNELEKERKEISRGGKLLRILDLPRRHREHGEADETARKRGSSGRKNQSKALASASWLALGSRSAGSAGDFFWLCVGLASKRASGQAAALSSSTKIRHGIRRDNWSEGRFGCRWPL